MPFRPRRPTPPGTRWPNVRPAGPLPPTPASPAHRLGLTLTAHTAVEAAHGALRDALLDLGAPSHDLADDGAEPDPPPADPFAEAGVPGGGAPDLLPFPPARRAAPGGSAGSGYAHDRVHAAVGAYARALRRDGVGLPAALVAVRATVMHGAPFVAAEAFAAVQRDAADCCLAAYFAH
jgi:hypothetical protein